MRRRRRRLGRGRRVELALAVAFIAAAVLEQLVRRDTEHSPRALVWIAAVAAPLFVRRTRPVAGTLVAAALIAAASDTSGSFPPTLFVFVLPRHPGGRVRRVRRDA